MTRRRALRAALALAALAGAAASAAGQEADDARRVLNPVSEVARDDLAAFRDRPLFSPTRRAVIPDAVAPPPEQAVDTTIEDPAPNVRLTGIVEGEEGALAVVRDLDSGATLTLRVGDAVGSWTLSRIEGAGVTLTAGERRMDLRLFLPAGGQSDAMTPASEPAPAPAPVLGAETVPDPADPTAGLAADAAPGPGRPLGTGRVLPPTVQGAVLTPGQGPVGPGEGGVR